MKQIEYIDCQILHVGSSMQVLEDTLRLATNQIKILEPYMDKKILIVKNVLNHGCGETSIHKTYVIRSYRHYCQLAEILVNEISFRNASNPAL